MWTIRHILVPTDLSEPAERALERALDLAAQHHASITLLNASDESLRDYYPSQFESDRAAMERLLAAENPPEIQVNITQRDGSPSEAILRVADEVRADLIVMGTHGRKGIRRAVLGSVTEAVVRSSGSAKRTLTTESNSSFGSRTLRQRPQARTESTPPVNTRRPMRRRRRKKSAQAPAWCSSHNAMVVATCGEAVQVACEVGNCLRGVPGHVSRLAETCASWFKEP